MPQMHSHYKRAALMVLVWFSKCDTGETWDKNPQRWKSVAMNEFILPDPKGLSLTVAVSQRSLQSRGSCSRPGELATISLIRVTETLHYYFYRTNAEWRKGASFTNQSAATALD